MQAQYNSTSNRLQPRNTSEDVNYPVKLLYPSLEGGDRGIPLEEIFFERHPSWLIDRNSKEVYCLVWGVNEESFALYRPTGDGSWKGVQLNYYHTIAFSDVVTALHFVDRQYEGLEYRMRVDQADLRNKDVFLPRRYVSKEEIPSEDLQQRSVSFLHTM